MTDSLGQSPRYTALLDARLERAPGVAGRLLFGRVDLAEGRGNEGNGAAAS
jgi:hypothetical protein